MRILALEPWYGGSHRTFLDGLTGHSRHEIDTITMSARFWKWRMHGGAVTMARKAEHLYKGKQKPDLIFASSMVNLPAFLALTRDDLGGVPVVMYMHLKTAAHIRDKSSVLHLGLDLRGHDKYASAYEGHAWGPGMKPPIVLWNQRWEYDKDPEAFFRVMNRLDDSGHTFRLILAGEHFEEQPREFEKAFERYAERILHYGYAEDFREYSRLLHRADLVVSTSQHEFFGISMLKPFTADVTRCCPIGFRIRRSFPNRCTGRCCTRPSCTIPRNSSSRS